MFYGLTINELELENWTKEEITDELLLFHKDIYKPEENADGFEFCCIYFVSATHDPSKSNGMSDVKYEVVFEGRAYFDGVRHLYFGKEETDNYGYLYYQDIPLLIKALKKLDDLQVDKCRYVRNERISQIQKYCKNVNDL